MPRRVEIGVVTGAKVAKTRRVEVTRLVKHPQYGKFIRRRTVCYAHDEQNESGLGDTVEIVEARPMSRMKRWQLVRVVEKSRAVDLVALRAKARGQARAEEDLAAAAGLTPGGEPAPADDAPPTDGPAS